MKHFLIVEDDPVISQDLAFILEDMGHTTYSRAMEFEDALEKLANQNFDLVLLDINLSSEEGDGVGVANWIAKHKPQTPFIFITSYYNAETVSRAKETKPMAYILKPFNSRDIQINVEMALFKSASKDKRILIKGHHEHVPVEIEDILYLSAADNYTEIITATKTVTSSQPLKTVLERLPNEFFARIHKSYAVRMEAISMIKSAHVVIGQDKIPIGRAYKEEFFARFGSR